MHKNHHTIITHLPTPKSLIHSITKSLKQISTQDTFDQLFHDTSLEVGKNLSKTEREYKKNLADDKNLIYGEVEYVNVNFT